MKKLGLDIKLAEENARKVAELTELLAAERKKTEQLTEENDSLRTKLSGIDTDRIAASIDEYSRKTSDLLKAVMERIKADGYGDIADFLASELAKRDGFISSITRELNFLALSATKKSERQVKDSNGLKRGQTLDGQNMKHAAREDAKARGNNGVRHNPHDEVPCEQHVEEVFPAGFSRDDLKGATVLERRRVYRLIFVRGHVVRRFTYLMSVRTADGRILKAASPLAPLRGSTYSSSLCSHIITSKFGWHQPVTSLTRQFDDMGFTVSESTLNGLVMKISSSLFFRNMDTVLMLAVCESGYSQMDESYGYVKTSVAKADDDFIRQCWFWGLLAMDTRLIRYSCSGGSRSDEVGYKLVSMIDHLCIIQSDAKSCYRNMSKEDRFGNITRVGCTQHMKRKFNTKDPRALEVYTMLNRLYVLEHERLKLSSMDEAQGKKWDVGRQLQWRKENMLPVLSDAVRHMRNILDGKPDPGTKAYDLSGQPISENFRKAINYALKEASAIECIFNQNVLCNMDTNDIERSNRTFGCHRRASKAFGSVNAAENQAILISLMESARMHDLNLEEYMKYLLDAMSVAGNETVKDRGSSEFEWYRSLLPDRYAASHPRSREVHPAPPLSDAPLNEGAKRKAYRKRERHGKCHGSAELSGSGSA